ncbi:MAG TPA: hypothetical protein VLE70_12280 [Anaerolineae bacterium]|nr:hypothetical protein [Anaerolineae bacterium]
MSGSFSRMDWRLQAPPDPADTQRLRKPAGVQHKLGLEQASQKRGARLAIVETFSRQAPDFYVCHSYEAFGLVEGYGPKYARHFSCKALR